MRSCEDIQNGSAIGKFSLHTLSTLTSQLLSFVFVLGTSIVIARTLGPAGKGVYSLALLIPSLVVTLTHLGIQWATVYYVAQRRYPVPEVLGNNIWLASWVGAAGVGIGGLLILFRDWIVPGVPVGCLLLALIIIPAELLFSYVHYILLGLQRIGTFNAIGVIHKVLTLFLVAAVVWLGRGGVTGALIASILSWLATDLLLLVAVTRSIGSIIFRINWSYVRSAVIYGIQSHIGNIFWFLTHRIDLLLVNGYLGSVAVGYYSLGVAVAEYLWMISQAASTVLLPRVAAETNERLRQMFTPLVARTVLLFTAMGAAVMFVLSPWLISSLYSDSFLPASQPLRILLIGIVALSVGRVLANDIAGRGQPLLNTYVVAMGFIVNVALNIMLIPRYGISGAAWASSASYTLILFIRLFFYCRLSGNRWTKVILPQRGDWALYWKTVATLRQWVQSKLQRR